MLKSFIYITAAVTLVGCDRGLQFSSTDTSKPGINCVVQPEEFSVPTLVQQDQRFAMSFNRKDVSWRLSNGVTDISFEGSQVETSLNAIGTYVGSVSGRNNCNRQEGREFVIQVVERVEGLALVINNDDRYTRSQAVTLSLSAIGATEMYITNTPSCTSGGTWVPFNRTSSWNLGSQNQLTRVYAKFRNAVIETPCISDDITHDNIAPQTRFVSAPNGFSGQTASFQFAADDAVSGVKALYCRLDNAAYQACALQMTYSNLSEGSHSVSIYAEDNAGNVSPAETHTWVVDTIAPAVRITQAPAVLTNALTANFAFVGEDNGVAINNFECSLDGASFTACTSPRSYSVTDGSHTFRVRGKDAAGNMSNEASHTWVVDSSAPTVIITLAPANPTKDTSARFEFTVQDNDLLTTTCQLNSQAAVACANSMDYSSLTNGIYTFRVTATDRAGNVGSATHTWEVNDKITDQVIPVVDNGGSTDILFMMNTRNSMYDIYSNKISNQFRSFLSVLGSIDFRIGVVTSDYRDGASPYREGRIVPIEKNNTLRDEFMLLPTTQDLGRKFIDTLIRREVTCVWGTWTGPNGSFCGATGWDNPISTQVIRAGLRTFDHPDNAGFFRNEASLNVIIVSDSDEVCQSGMYGPDGACLAQDHLHSPEAFISKIQTTFPGKNFKVHALTHRAGDVGCDMGPSNVGDNYIKLARLTGGVSRSICRNDAAEGAALANAIKNSSQQSFQLRCDPDDANKDGVIDARDITFSLAPAVNPAPQLILNGRSIRFNPTLTAGTQITLRYICK